MVYLSSPHRTSAAQLVHMDRLAPLWGPGPAAAVASEDSAYLAARHAFAAADPGSSLRSPQRKSNILPSVRRCAPIERELWASFETKFGDVALPTCVTETDRSEPASRPHRLP